VRSPLAEVKGRRASRARAAKARPPLDGAGSPSSGDDGAPGFVWGDQRR
jgi:hypothetical protein